MHALFIRPLGFLLDDALISQRTASFALNIAFDGTNVDREPLGSGKQSLSLRCFNNAISHEVKTKFQCSNYSFVKKFRVLIFCILYAIRNFFNIKFFRFTVLLVT